VLRNALIPILTYVAVALPSEMIGLFLLEKFFSIPGLGREVIVAVERSDFPVIKAITIYLAIFTMLSTCRSISTNGSTRAWELKGAAICSGTITPGVTK
jgi:ABC-type dipeptide/oligopeptide/nickel transport system permease component